MFELIASPFADAFERKEHIMRRTLLAGAIAAMSLAALSPTAFAAANPSAGHSAGGSTPRAETATTGPAQTTAMAPSAKSTTTPATRGPAKTGQPNQSCEDTPNTPGNSAMAPGSAFNPDGTAGTKYAGQQPQNSRNSASVSQYDVACARPSK
jgi:hypothetical protein